jgi:alkaline phosphatase D
MTNLGRFNFFWTTSDLAGRSTAVMAASAKGRGMRTENQRRKFLKALGLAMASPLFSQVGHASENDWVLGFGSCMDQRKSQRFWTHLLRQRHDHFVFLGDNLYPSRDNLPELQVAYEDLSRNSGLRALTTRVGVSAVWDDHDFGADNADSSLPYRSESQTLFRNFWKQEYATENDGVYSSKMFRHEGKLIHLILLDTRFHRTPYQLVDSLENNNENADSQLLGKAQWQWLEEQMRKSADVKIIGSSIQVLSAEHRFEKWSNYPAEYDRLIQLIEGCRAPCLILSGDRHQHEISRLELRDGRVLYDFTSSGLNKAEGLSRFEKNRLRVQRHLDDGFGEVRLRFSGSELNVTMTMIDKRGRVCFTQQDLLL